MAEVRFSNYEIAYEVLTNLMESEELNAKDVGIIAALLAIADSIATNGVQELVHFEALNPQLISLRQQVKLNEPEKLNDHSPQSSA